MLYNMCANKRLVRDNAIFVRKGGREGERKSHNRPQGEGGESE